MQRAAVVALGALLAGAGPVLGVEPLSLYASPASAQVGQEITFQFFPVVRLDGDAVTVSFGDGGSATVTYSIGCGMLGGCNAVKHVYAGVGTFTVSGSGKAGGVDVAGTVQVTISELPEEQHYWLCTGAHQPGYNNSVWRTDVDVHNPGTAKATYRVSLLKRDADNRSAQSVDYTVHGGRSVHHTDILFDVFGFEGAAALRVTPLSGPLVVQSRTYNQLTVGSYGQYVPGLTSSQAVVGGTEGRLVGLFHDPGLARGMRTNFGLVNASVAPINVEIAFWGPLGTPLGVRVVELKALEYKQLNKVFEMVTSGKVDGGFLVVRSTTTGGRFFAFASIVDNVTGDPIYVPAVVMAAASKSPAQ